MTAPGSASACTRAATLGASPNTSLPQPPPPLGPNSSPMRAETRGARPPAVVAAGLRQERADRERRAHRALGVILLRLAMAEIGGEARALGSRLDRAAISAERIGG